MQSTFKICGLSTPQSIAAAEDSGAVYLGFIFFPKSPRNVSPSQAAELVSGVKQAQTVAVTVNAEDAFLDDIVEQINPDWLQLHGSESAQRVSEVKRRYQRPVIKALAIREAADLDRIAPYETCADMLLLDAKPPSGSELPGGNGVSFDWSLINELKSKLPILLSGGIDIQNLSQAMAFVDSDQNSIVGIDVSSGVESAPGVKDISKIENLLMASQSGDNPAHQLQD